MKRKTIGVSAALVFALVGVALLITYSRASNQDVAAPVEWVPVLVLEAAVPAGTPVSDLQGRLMANQVDVTAAPPARLADLGDVANMVTARDLGPDRPLEVGDFVDPAAYARPIAPISVPADLLQASVALSPERVLGGQIRPGDKVAVVASFPDGVIPSGDQAALASAGDTSAEIVIPDEADVPQPQTLVTSGVGRGRTSHLLVHQALVTNVQVENLPVDASANEDPTVLSLAPTGNFVVSLGLSVADLERLVFAKEFGTLWLAIEPDMAVDTESPRVQHANSIWVFPERPTTEQ